MPESRRTLVIHDPDHYRVARQFSLEKIKDPLQSLDSNLMYLMTGNYSEADELHLYKDFVPHSFAFDLRKEGKTIMNGGIICHGQGLETFSVEVAPTQGIHYSIHT